MHSLAISYQPSSDVIGFGRRLIAQYVKLCLTQHKYGAALEVTILL